MIGTTLNGLVEVRAIGRVVAVVGAWPTVLHTSAIDLPQTVGLRIEEMIGATLDETTSTPTSHLQMLELIETGVGHLEATAGGHAVHQTEVGMIHTFRLQGAFLHVEMTVRGPL